MVQSTKKSVRHLFLTSFGMIIGTFMAAFALKVILMPNKIIDGGVIGVSIILSELYGEHLLYPLVILLNIPFLVLGFRHVSRSLVVQMFVSVIVFVGFAAWIDAADFRFFQAATGDLLEIVVIGGVMLGAGVGLIIRWGGCLDGTEIMGILLNKRYGITVGTVVLLVNSMIFTAQGFVFVDWHAPIQSLITFFIVMKTMDMVIMGLDEMKAVTIITKRPKEVARELMHELGLGLTILNGRGGYSGEEIEMLYLVAERLQIVGVKTVVNDIDPNAFIAIENLHEVSHRHKDLSSNKGEETAVPA